MFDRNYITTHASVSAHEELVQRAKHDLDRRGRSARNLKRRSHKAERRAVKRNLNWENWP